MSIELELEKYRNLKGKERLEKELELFFELPEECFGVDYWDPEKPDPFHWQITLLGPVGTEYEGGFFKVEVVFDKNYPETKPKVNFRTKIHHCNIYDGDGHVCLSTLNDWSQHKIKPFMQEVINDIFYLLWNSTIDNINNGYYDCETYKKEHDKKAREWVLKYANQYDFDNPEIQK